MSTTASIARAGEQDARRCAANLVGKGRASGRASSGKERAIRASRGTGWRSRTVGGAVVAAVAVLALGLAGAAGDSGQPDSSSTRNPLRPANFLDAPIDVASASPLSAPAPVDAPPGLAATVATPLPPQPAPSASPPPPPPAPRPIVNRPPPRPNRSASPDHIRPIPPHGNAVHPDDFPDPFVLRAGGFWYAFSTQRGMTNVPVMRSADLASWEPLGDALPRLPVWALPGSTWAPAVLERPAGFVMYYTTKHAPTGLQCISRALSVLPAGPYVDASEAPLVCQMERGGSIDPSPFIDGDGTAWLLWKSEGTLQGEPTRIWSQRLSADGTALTGPGPYELLRTAEVWEGPIVEGPVMVRDPSGYHLLYSANRWETASYAIGHATCAGPAGPCHRSGRGPVLRTSTAEAGPGGPEVFRDALGNMVLAYHAWTPPHIGYPHGARRLHLASLRFEGARAVIGPRRAL